MYNGVLAHVLFPSTQKQINKLIKTRKKIKSILVKSLNSNSESSNLKFKELCLAFANFFCLTAVFSWLVMVQRLTKKRLRINFFATLLQTELNTSEVARFTTNENKPGNLICCNTGSSTGGKTPNIAIQLNLQWCCKTSCTCFVALLTVA